MKVNRYSRVTPSQYDAMSMQEIFSVPLAKQRQHEQQQAQLDELGLFDVNRLNQDDDLAREYIDDYRSKVNSQVDQILSKGVDHNTMRGVRGLISDKQKWMSNDGDGGKIQNNFNSYQKYKTGLDDLLKDGKIGNQRHAALLNQAVSKYGGVGKEGQLNFEAAANRVDAADKLQKYAKDMMSNPVEFEHNTGYKFDPESKMFVNTKTGKSYTPKDTIKNVLERLAYTDPEITNYYGQRERLGLGSMKDSLGLIIDGFNSGYSVNKSTSDVKGSFMPEWMAKASGMIDDENLDPKSYELGSAKEVKVRQADMYTRLNHIINGDTKPGMSVLVKPSMRNSDGVYDPNYPMLKEAYDKSVSEKGSNYKIDEYESEYNTVYEGLVNSGVIKNKDKYSKEAMIAVSKYLENHQNLDYSPKIITNGLVKTYENKDGKFKKSTTKELMQGIYNQAENRVWYDPKTNEVIKYEDLPEDDKKLIEKAVVSGVHSPKNFLKDHTKDPINTRVLTSPYEIKLSNGKKYLVGRSEGELNTPAYKVDTEYNDIWRNISKYPELPHKSTLKDLGDVNIIKMSDGRVIINKLREDGSNSETSFTLVNDDALYKYMLKSNNITNTEE